VRSLFFLVLIGCATAEAAPEPQPIRVDPVNVPGDLPAYVLRGARHERHPIVFLGGMCVHPEGYVQSFAHAAAEHGTVIGLQGEVACGGGMSRWAYDLDRTNRRIDAAFAAAGLQVPTDAIVIGYSQGAERAEQLVARWPEKYTRAILIASPVDPKPRAKAAVFMAGDFDISKARMQSAALAAGCRSKFILLRSAYHGQLGPTPNETMAEALTFLDP
jgi:pimeloyl-ACP methyl ester carboxylesterase